MIFHVLRHRLYPTWHPSYDILYITSQVASHLASILGYLVYYVTCRIPHGIILMISHVLRHRLYPTWHPSYDILYLTSQVASHLTSFS